MNNNFEYDVCLSFAGEQRNYVKRVYEELCKNHIRVFYDADEDIETLLWGNNLIDVFKNIYKNKSKYCVMFLSKEYAEKAWTNHERKNALSRAITDKEVYILPVRFDQTEIPGLDDSTLYFDALKKKPEEIAKHIILKLGKEPFPLKLTQQEAIHSLCLDLTRKIKDASSDIYLVESGNTLKLFPNYMASIDESYGAFIYCDDTETEDMFHVININIFNKYEEKMSHINILKMFDEVVSND